MITMIVRVCQVAAGVLLAGLVAVTFVDVIGRQFGHPLGFAFEFTKVGVGALFYTALPLVILRRDHIVVDLLPFSRSSGIGRVVDHVADFAIAGAMIAIVYVLWDQGRTRSFYGTRFMFTNWRMDVVVYGMAAMAAIAVLFALRNLVLAFRSPEQGATRKETVK